MAARKPLTDAGVGRVQIWIKWGLSWQATTMCLWASAAAFAIPYILWFSLASPFATDLVKFEFVSRIVPAKAVLRWRLRENSVDPAILTAQLPDGVPIEWMTAAQARTILHSVALGPLTVFEVVAAFSVLSAIGGFAGMGWYQRAEGEGGQENQRVRGAELVISGPELDKLVRADGGGQYTLADVALPETAAAEGILVQGAQGSGKTLSIHDLQLQAFKYGRKCVIVDHSGEFFRAYFRPGKDFFFNPALEGSVGWSLFNELRYTYDADALAQAFLPSGPSSDSGTGQFFKDAARALFSAIVLRLTEAGAVNTCDIADAFLKMPADEMDHLIRHTVASSAVGGDSKTQRQVVISSIAVYLSGIASVPKGDWTLRQFFDAEDDARLFIVGTDDTKAMFAPLYRLMLTVAFGAIAAKQEIVYEDRYWFFLDELPTLGDIKIDEHLATLRKYGVCIVAGIQSESQLVTSLGKDRADTVTNCFNTALLLRANEPAMQERIAKRLGKLEMDTVARNQTLAVSDSRDGAALNVTEHEKWLVMPSQIGSLDTCNGWVKMVGTYPAGRVNYGSWRRPKGRKGGKYRTDRFGPVQPLPERNRNFVISRLATENALASVKDAFDRAQIEAAAEKKSKADVEATRLAAAEAEEKLAGRNKGASLFSEEDEGDAEPTAAEGGAGSGGRSLSSEPTAQGLLSEISKTAAAESDGDSDAARRVAQQEQFLTQTNADQALGTDQISLERGL